MENVVVEVEKIEECLIKLGVDEVKAKARASEIKNDFDIYVKANYQEELDYYLANLKPSDSPVGQRLAKLMLLHLGCFFDALTTLAME